MTETIEKVARPGSSHRAALHHLGAVAFVTFAVITGLGAAGFRANLTASEPLGIWRIVPMDRQVQVGDLVFICPPVLNVMRKARARGYLRPGLCAGGFAPLIKTVVAVPGQSIEIDGTVHIDGAPLPHSNIAVVDGQGREMRAHTSGIVPQKMVFLHSAFPGSFDSRYFGPLPADHILGLAREVWTYAP